MKKVVYALLLLIFITKLNFFCKGKSQKSLLSVCPVTGLIFTGIQEGAQPGGLTPPGQTEQGIPYHVPLCWVPVGGSGAAGTHSRLGSTQRQQSWRAALWVVRFMLCFLLICIFVVPVPFVCCSVKLPLSRPTSFCLFLSILLRTPARGGAAV